MSKGQYQYYLEKKMKINKSKARIKLAERIYYAIIALLFILCYQSPNAQDFLFVDQAWTTIPSLIIFVLIINTMNWYYDYRFAKYDKKMDDIKNDNSDIKTKLLSQMDPLLVQALRDIIRQDMKSEMEELRNSDMGCTQKCRLMTEIAEKEVLRNQGIVKQMIEFQWCHDCTVDTGAVQNITVCKRGCGRKLV